MNKEVELLWSLIQKHFPENQWRNAMRVALGESGGRASAVGDAYPILGKLIPSYGYFQIRALPGRPSPKQLLDPEFNIKYAADLFKRTGDWSPWTVAREIGLVPGHRVRPDVVNRVNATIERVFPKLAQIPTPTPEPTRQAPQPTIQPRVLREEKPSSLERATEKVIGLFAPKKQPLISPLPAPKPITGSAGTPVPSVAGRVTGVGMMPPMSQARYAPPSQLYQYQGPTELPAWEDGWSTGRVPREEEEKRRRVPVPSIASYWI